MKKRIDIILMMLFVAVSMTACGDAFRLMSNYDEAQDTLEAQLESDTGLEVVGENQGIDLEDAINDALEANGATMMETEGDLKFDVPEGFVYNQEQRVYKSADSLASINYVTSNNDGNFDLLTQAELEEELEVEMTALLGVETNITITSWENISVDGYEAIRYTANYKIGDLTTIYETQIMINGTKKYHFVTYSQNSTTKYTEVFEAFEETLRFE